MRLGASPDLEDHFRAFRKLKSTVDQFGFGLPSRTPVEGQNDVVLYEPRLLAGRVFAILADVFCPQAQLVRFQAEGGSLTVGKLFENDSAQRHSAQVPGGRTPGNVTASPAFRKGEHHGIGLSVAENLCLQRIGVAGIVEDPLQIGRRQQRLALERFDGVTRLQTRLGRDGPGIHGCDRGALFRV